MVYESEVRLVFSVQINRMWKPCTACGLDLPFVADELSL